MTARPSHTRTHHPESARPALTRISASGRNHRCHRVFRSNAAPRESEAGNGGIVATSKRQRSGVGRQAGGIAVAPAGRHGRNRAAGEEAGQVRDPGACGRAASTCFGVRAPTTSSRRRPERHPPARRHPRTPPRRTGRLPRTPACTRLRSTLWLRCERGDGIVVRFGAIAGGSTRACRGPRIETPTH